jgi:hypothetical protein
VIRTHEFNTAWWGKDVGIVDSAAFFDQTDGERRSQLARHDWAEFHVESPAPALVRKMHDARFVFADAQMEFRVRLAGAEAERGRAADIELIAAAGRPFEVRTDEVRAFEGDRFFLLPGVTTERVEARYALWSRRLIAESPATCLRATRDGQTQGWFLSAPSRGGLELTLAMLSKTAAISGSLLYSAALAAYAAAGHTVGFARYSYRHSAVANIYASLGARITGARETWLWIAR